MPRVPRVTSRREALRLGGHRRTELGHVGAAERDKAGRPELLGQERRHRPGHLTHRPDTERGGLALDRAAQVLEQDGHTAERPGGQVPVGLLPGRVEPGPDDGVKLRVNRLNAGDRRLGEFLRAYLSAPDEVGLGRGVQPSHVGHTVHATVLIIGGGWRRWTRLALTAPPDASPDWAWPRPPPRYGPSAASRPRTCSPAITSIPAGWSGCAWAVAGCSCSSPSGPRGRTGTAGC